MPTNTLESLSFEQLATAHGGQSGMPASAQWIMQHESGGNPRAQNPTSTAYGAFQMLKATRKQYMGADWQSSNLNKQYEGASGYVKDRYGSWDKAKAFWQKHHWY